MLKPEPPNPIRAERRRPPGLCILGRIGQSDNEHPWTALGNEPLGVTHKHIAGVSEPIELDDGRFQILAAMRRSKAEDVLQENRVRTPIAHFVQDASELPEHARLRTPEPSTIASQR